MNYNRIQDLSLVTSAAAILRYALSRLCLGSGQRVIKSHLRSFSRLGCELKPAADIFHSLAHIFEAIAAAGIQRGIEVGHVFALGTRYSEAMGATYLDAEGQSHLIEMGCYGIGVTRVVAAAIEQNNDDKGIVWTDAMAPFRVAIAPVGYDRSPAVREAADRLHDSVEADGVEVLMDDRGERPGVMFADLELIGIPHRITIGDRGLKDGKVEYQSRRTGGAAELVSLDAIAGFIRDRLAQHD